MTYRFYIGDFDQFDGEKVKLKVKTLRTGTSSTRWGTIHTTVEPDHNPSVTVGDNPSMGVGAVFDTTHGSTSYVIVRGKGEEMPWIVRKTRPRSGRWSDYGVVTSIAESGGSLKSVR